MEVVAGAVVVVVALGVIGWLSLRADMSDRFSHARQVQDQKNSVSLYDVETRERKLFLWVLGLAVSVAVSSLLAAAGTIGFFAEGAKGYGNANDTVLQVSYIGMTMAPILAIIAAYRLVGMIVRLRAWRQVRAELPVSADSDEIAK